MFKKKFISIILAAVIALMIIPSNVFAAAETWQTAITLTKDQPETFTIPASNAVVWYKVSVPNADQTIQISVSKVGGGSFANGVYIRLYDGEVLMSGKTTQLTNWYANAQKTDMLYKFTATGDYYIKVEGGVNQSPGLQIQYTLIAPDAYENNDTWQNATLMTKDTPIDFTITASNDEDWYKVSVPNDDQTIQISVSKVGGGSFANGVYIRLYDGEVLMSGKNTQLTNWYANAQKTDMLYKFTATGDYYIKVEDGVNQSPGLQIQYTLIAPDAYENNDTWQNAMPMTKDKPMAFTITASNDEDWYKVSVPNANQTIQISVSKVGGGSFANGVYIRLYDGEVLMSGKNTQLTNWYANIQKTDMTYTLQKAGDYYIKIEDGINFSLLTVTCNFNYEPVLPLIYGDVNGDGKVNIADLILLSQYCTGNNVLTRSGLLAADVNFDGEIAMSDLVRLARSLAEIDNSPLGQP